MKAFSTAAVGAAFLALAIGPASAAVVCNEEGDCWRVQGEPRYEPTLKLRIQKDDWKWQDNDKDRYRWRDSGRGDGYYRGGVWVQIK